MSTLNSRQQVASSISSGAAPVLVGAALALRRPIVLLLVATVRLFGRSDFSGIGLDPGRVELNAVLVNFVLVSLGSDVLVVLIAVRLAVAASPVVIHKVLPGGEARQEEVRHHNAEGKANQAHGDLEKGYPPKARDDALADALPHDAVVVWPYIGAVENSPDLFEDGFCLISNQLHVDVVDV
eukprot:UN4476